MQHVKTALIHDWLTVIGGGERVLEAISELYPAPIYTLVKNEKKLKDTFLADKEIHTSFLQKFPKASTHYRNYLPFFPMAIEQFDLSSYDLLITTSHAVAKGVLTHSSQLHLCYCFTPMRYAWDLYHQYLEGLGAIRKKAAKITLHYLRNWDIATLNRVDHFASVSHYIAKRIKKVYGKESTVIYPPVRTHLFTPSAHKESYYLAMSRMVPYKKMDLIVEAFGYLPDKKLIVIGDGPDFKKIKSKAGKNVELLGYLDDATSRDYLAKAKAFIFAPEEDFGIMPIEAQAAGTPVIAFGRGGCLETVVAEKTGLFFQEQTISSLIGTIQEFESKQDQFDPQVIKQHAEQFNEQRFKDEFKQFVDLKYQDFHENSHLSRR